MSVEIGTILFFLAYELLLFFSGIRLFYILVSNNSKISISVEKSIIVWLSLSILLSVVFASFFSFMKINDQAQYLLAATILFVVLHFIKKSNLSDFFSYLKNTIFQLTKSAFDWKIVIIFIALLPMLWWGLRPPDDTDSIYLLNSNFSWITNQLTPYNNWANYTPFHQLSFVPSMVVTSSDNYFWLVMIKPVILLGLVTYAIGNELKLNKNLIWLSVFTSLLFFRIWMGWGPAYGSLKEDALMGVGFLLIALSVLNSRNEKLSRLSFLFLLFGIMFASAKWLGLAYVVLGLGLFVIFNWKEIRLRKKSFFVWLTIISLVFISLTGQVHIQHFLEYGNPFYPVKISIFGIELPGTEDITERSKSSIIANLDDIRIWQILIPTDRPSPGGLLFPLTMAFGTIGCFIIFTYNAMKYVRKKNQDTTILFLSIFVLLSWLLYFNTIGTACHPLDIECDNLIFLRDLRSMRYQDGPIFLTELFFVFILVRLGIPNRIIFGIIGINLVSRLYLDYQGRMEFIFKNYIQVEWLIYPILIAIALFFIVKYLRNDVGRVIVVCIVGGFIFVYVPIIVDDLTVFFAVNWKEVREAIYELPSSKIFLISIYDNAATFPSSYIIHGNRFQHEVEMGSFDELNKILQSQNIYDNPDYVAFLCQKEYKMCVEDKEKLSEEMMKFNFIVKANAKSGILFEFRK